MLSGFVGVALLSATVFSSQIISLTGSLDTYKSNLTAKVRAVSSATSGGALRRAIDSIEALQREVEKQTQATPAEEQIRVVVDNEPSGGIHGVLAAVRSILGPVETAILTLVYIAVLLAGQYDLLDRVVRLAGIENMTESTAALSLAGERLSRFFLGQGAINLAFGAVTALVLAALGIPNAVLWGMAAALLRFIPFIGILGAAIPPVLLAAAVSSGWGLLLGVLVFFLLMELVTSNLVEPIVMGRHVGLSPLAFIAAGSFWWVVWGPVGLLLAAPLTTALVVLGDFFPSMAFISLLFGDRPPLTPQQVYYHRLLAGDSTTAAEPLESYGDTRELLEVCDRVALPALAIAAKDARDRRISVERAERLAETLREATDSAFGVKEPSLTTRVVIIPGLGPIDAAAGALAAAVLSEATGKTCACVRSSTGLLALASLREDEDAHPEALVLFTVGGLAYAQASHMARRAGAIFPDARILLFHTDKDESAAAGQEETQIAGCGTLNQVAEHLRVF